MGSCISNHCAVCIFLFAFMGETSMRDTNRESLLDSVYIATFVAVLFIVCTLVVATGYSLGSLL